jgi:hypothetical protein
MQTSQNKLRQRRKARYAPLRSMRALSPRRFGPLTSTPPTADRKKSFRKSPIRSGVAPTMARKRRQSPAKHSLSKVKKFPNANLRSVRIGRHTVVRIKPPLKGRNANRWRSGKLCHGPFQVRAIRVHRGVPSAKRSHRHKHSAAALQDVFATGFELIDQVILKAQQLTERPADTTLQDNASQSPAAIQPAVEIRSLPIDQEPIEVAVDDISTLTAQLHRGAAIVIDQKDAAMRNKAPAHDDRILIAAAKLELAIAEAVKKTGPGCQAFVGVIVRHVKPKSGFDDNWALRGVKFGRSDRETVNTALATIVERMRREFKLSKD